MLNICARYRWLAAGLVLLAGEAVAQEAVRVVVADAACVALTRHVPAPDVAYTPGLDARGQPVVPADLSVGVSAGASIIPMPVTFDVTLDVARQFGLPPETEALLTVAHIGERDGEVLINGNPVSELGRSIALLACEERHSPR